MNVFRPLSTGLLILIAPVAAHAQTIPTLENYSLPAQERPPEATPTPVPLPTIAPPPLATPLPLPVPTLAPTPTPRPAIPVPQARSAPTATVQPSPVPAPTPSSDPTFAPEPLPSPAISDVPASSAIVSPLPTEEAAEPGGSRWPWLLGIAVVVLGGLGVWLARRRGREEDASEDEYSPEPAPEPVPPPPEVARPRLTLDFRPTRAGINMLSATVEGELTVANDSDAPVEGVRVRTALLSAHAGQDADLALFAAEPILRPATPPFTLASGESRVIRVVAATPHEAIRTMTAAGRPMFVPVLAVNLRFGEAGQAAQAFAVGVERADSAKLAPFWLDVPPRTYDRVGARGHGGAVER